MTNKEDDKKASEKVLLFTFDGGTFRQEETPDEYDKLPYDIRDKVRTLRELVPRGKLRVERTLAWVFPGGEPE